MPRTLLTALALLPLATGCGWIASATSEGTEALGNLLLSPADERALGNQLSAQVKQQQRVHPDAFVQQYVDEVARQVLAQVPEAERKQFDFEFTVLDEPDQVNAFALPGGKIFVMSGLLEAVDSEAELASVLGHEIAHVVAGHPSQQLAAQVGIQTLGSLALGQQAGLVQQIAAQVASTGYLAAHTRTMEREADELGLKFLSSARYEPAAMADFFAKLGKMHGGGERNFVENFVATHPAPTERARKIQERIREANLQGEQQQLVGGLERAQQQITGVGGSGAQ